MYLHIVFTVEFRSLIVIINPHILVHVNLDIFNLIYSIGIVHVCVAVYLVPTLVIIASLPYFPPMFALEDRAVGSRPLWLSVSDKTPHPEEEYR